jgi:hypothetical protein
MDCSTSAGIPYWLPRYRISFKVLGSTKPLSTFSLMRELSSRQRLLLLGSESFLSKIRSFQATPRVYLILLITPGLQTKLRTQENTPAGPAMISATSSVRMDSGIERRVAALVDVVHSFGILFGPVWMCRLFVGLKEWCVHRGHLSRPVPSRKETIDIFEG